MYVKSANLITESAPINKNVINAVQEYLVVESWIVAFAKLIIVKTAIISILCARSVNLASGRVVTSLYASLAQQDKEVMEPSHVRTVQCRTVLIVPLLKLMNQNTLSVLRAN
jgi:hypothetical protein